MNKPILKTLRILILGTSLLAPAAKGDEIATTARIAFKGSSTLHDFEGTATTQPFAATFREDPDTGQIHVAAKASLRVRDMTTKHKKRDQNMFKMFDLEHFELINGEIAEAVLPKEGQSKTILRLKICNTEQDVPAVLSDLQQDGDRISCRMTFPVSLKAFNLKSPSVMGMIRVADTVQVECSVEGFLPKTTPEE